MENTLLKLKLWKKMLACNFIYNLFKEYQFQRNLSNALDDFRPGCDIELWAAAHPDIIGKIIKMQLQDRTVFEVHLI